MCIRDSHLTDPGRQALRDMLATGRYRIGAPEEGALLVVEWLRGRGATSDAARALSAIGPWAGRLRFYPEPAETPLPEGETVYAESASDVAARLRGRRPNPRVEAMREALLVWTPMYDRAVSLVLETVVDGRPFASRPPDWDARARDLLDDYRRARLAHRHCRKPDKPKENFARLRAHLATVTAGAGAPPPAVVADARGSSISTSPATARPTGCDGARCASARPATPRCRRTRPWRPRSPGGSRRTTTEAGSWAWTRSSGRSTRPRRSMWGSRRARGSRRR